MRCVAAVCCALLVLVSACTRTGRQVQEFEAAGISTTSSAPIARSQPGARVLVRRASIAVEVEEVAPAVERATRLAQTFEGYVENVTSGEDRTAHLRLRVPSTRLDEALDSLARLGKVTRRRPSSIAWRVSSECCKAPSPSQSSP